MTHSINKSFVTCVKGAVYHWTKLILILSLWKKHLEILKFVITILFHFWGLVIASSNRSWNRIGWWSSSLLPHIKLSFFLILLMKFKSLYNHSWFWFEMICHGLHYVLWFPAFSNHGWLFHAWNTTDYYSYCFDYLLCFLF